MSELRLLKETHEARSEINIPDSLLTAKMQPPTMHKLYSRPRLLARLELPSALTLVTAPAGCGKTALLCDWMALHPKSTSWLTLDESDNDLQQFLAYVAFALGVSIEIQSPEAMLIAVLNGTTHDEKPRALVLDEFQVITNSEVHRAIAFLLDHCPPNLRLIIAGRKRPPLPLARLRVRGQLNQIRSPELAFSKQETLEIFSTLPAAVSTDLLAQMEGWAAGLQFIALVAEECDDPGEQTWLARSYVREFVAQEILPTLPTDVQNFLLHTSILEALTPSLSDTLTGRKDSYAILESLVAEGNFVRRIGDKTYRCAPFFEAALREQLALTSPELMAQLLERAAAFTHNDEEAETTNDPALSQREHEVLTMLADGLSSPEIARRMIIAVSTVKTHIKHIYRKLEVDNRYQAIQRARELNLIQIEMEERMRKMFR